MTLKTFKILGIETSCDDTSICLLEGEARNLRFRHHYFFQSFSHEQLLAQWGGVVPEIAARGHLDKLAPLLQAEFASCPVSPKQLDAIAVTTHPGLLGPLLTGLNAAKTLALIHQLPLIPVNHLYAHLEAVQMGQSVGYPYLGLLVSGGHSIFFAVHSPRHFQVLGSTIDDAAGEAFDKGGRLLGLPYPAGQLIDQLSQGGDEERYPFPIGLRDGASCQLSFSGLKTSLRQFLLKHPQFREKILAQNYSREVKDLLASYQWAIVRALALKLHRALKQTARWGKIPIVVGGGVACNGRLRRHFQEEFPDSPLFFVLPPLCTDNGAMVAHLGLRNFHQRIPFPQCLSLDARSKFVAASS